MRKFLSILTSQSKELKYEDNVVHNCHKIIKTCPPFQPHIQPFQFPTVITVLIHTCIHPRLMRYVNCSYAYYWSQRHCSTSLLRYDVKRMSSAELSYLAPLGSENISAPYFKQCFFWGGKYSPHRLSQTPRLPVPRQK